MRIVVVANPTFTDKQFVFQYLTDLTSKLKPEKTTIRTIPKTGLEWDITFNWALKKYRVERYTPDYKKYGPEKGRIENINDILEKAKVVVVFVDNKPNDLIQYLIERAEAKKLDVRLVKRAK